ncbi:MAG: HPr kinase/phosphatase C-terminal domain-containing protein [Magnetospirillum sp.]|nr:HPr kinase/phosphatase C-terminal domain-containing protein [Magnetospirillum sp.]
MHLVHATSVEIGGHAVLIRGPSGSGKSDLALRLMDQGAQLVADDQTGLSAESGRLFVSCPPTIAGMIEVRGLGILRLPHRDRVPLALVVDLVAAKDVERLPEPSRTVFLGIQVPRLALCAFESSTPAKVRLAVTVATRDSTVL